MKELLIMEEIVFDKMQKICRLCLSAESKLIEILNNRDIEVLKIHALMEKLCHIQLPANDPLPKWICQKCNEKLIEFCQFINMCKGSERKLNEIYEKELKRIQKTCNIAIQPNDDNEVTTMEYQTTSPLPTMPVNSIENIASIENHSKDETSPVPSFVCDTCSMTLFSKESLADHVKSHLSNTKPEKSQPNKSSQRKCPKQDKTDKKLKPTNSPSSPNVKLISENMQRLKKTVTSEGQFLCDICGKALQTQSGMRLHLKMHSGLKPFKCKVCEKSFAIESYKKRHELTHTGDKAFMCHLCSASFASANGIRYHLMAHAGDARYSCSTCGKSFVRHKYLVEHEFTHTGEKPFACQLCGVAYANSGSLFVHKKKCKGVSNKRRENKRSEIVSNVYTKKVVEAQIVVVNSN